MTGPRLAILAMLEQVGGHRSADELVLALRRAGYHHARTTVYNALDDLARAGLVRAAPVDAGALRYESAGEPHHHFVCRRCGIIMNVPVAEDLASRPLPRVEGAAVDEIDIVYRGTCDACGQEMGAARSTEDAVTGAPDRSGEHVPQEAEGNGHHDRATVVMSQSGGSHQPAPPIDTALDAADPDRGPSAPVTATPAVAPRSPAALHLT